MSIENEDDGMKVAITQNSVGYGGRLAVITSIIYVLNESGITPDIFTFHINGINKEKIKRCYNKDIKFNIREIPSYIRLLKGELNILWFNYLSRFYSKEYDYFIDSNNTSFLMPRDVPILSYVHYPRKDRLLSQYVTIHQPEGKRKSWFKSPFDFHLKTTALFYRLNRRIFDNNMVICNSEFTRSRFLQQYPDYNKRILVLYPPVAVKNKVEKNIMWKKKSNSIVTLGRFSEDKRQLEQIQIAGQLPDYKFHIIGFAQDNNRYFAQCQNYIYQNNVSNIYLDRNISFKRKMEIMKSAKVFLHSTRNEPFGITTVEGILANCLPIVHDSGGQREVLPFQELRYSSTEEAILMIEKTMSNKIDTQFILGNLQEHILKYDEENFCDKFQKILYKFCNE